MSLCESCHAGCCRSFAIPASGADLIRIEADLGLSFWDFACRWADPEGIIARKYAPHFYFDDDPDTPFAICLLRSESTFHPGTPKCRFLVEGQPDDKSPLGAARCGIYKSRPSACRVFPTRLNATAELAVITDVPERVCGKGEPLYQLCPRPWEPADFDHLTSVQDLIVARYEMQFFHQVAERWNRRCGPWSLFPEFVRAVYARRVLPESEVPAAQPHPQLRVVRPEDDAERFAA